MFKKILLSLLALTLVSGCSHETKNVSYTTENLKDCVVAQEELTVDNWQNYYTIESYEGPALDAFGDPKDEGTLFVHYFKLKDDKQYIVSSDAVLQVEYDTTSTYLILDSEGNQIEEPNLSKDHSTQDTYLFSIPPFFVYSSFGHSGEEFDWYHNGSTIKAHEAVLFEVENINVTKAKGTIYTIDIPEDKWFTDEEGNRYLSLYNKDMDYTYHLYENGIVKGFDNKNNEDINTSSYHEETLKHYSQFTFNNNELWTLFWSIDQYLK